MAKHILEGRYFPFYMYGQPYNAGAAWEAYLATISFAIFGVGVVPLKATIVLLSLVSLFFFYRMVVALYDRKTAVLATIFMAIAPSLLKWNFQVRGYSFYFLSIPILTILFFSLVSGSRPTARKMFLFGLACGVSVWNLELIMSLVGAFGVLLLLRRRFSVRNAVAGTGGLLCGYAPAIVFNLTHAFSNWKEVFSSKISVAGLLTPATFRSIFVDEMPKFFAHDTVLWYYADTPAIGYVFYAISLVAVTIALFPFVKTPSKIREAIRGDAGSNDQRNDLLLFFLVLACFVPYVIAPTRVPGYFLGGCFFLAVLTARVVSRCFASRTAAVRISGALVLTGGLIAGAIPMIETGTRNEIETLTMDPRGAFYLARFPGADLQAVHRHLHERQISSMWTTMSFVYPFLFESGETQAVSDSIFGANRRVYPESVLWHQPTNSYLVFVVESKSPLRPGVERLCARFGVAPLIAELGTLTIIEERTAEQRVVPKND
jgi:hypothetical protein